MAHKNLWCQSDLGPIGKRVLCLKATEKGRLFCLTHSAPIWPTNDDGSPCSPEAKP